MTRPPAALGALFVTAVVGLGCASMLNGSEQSVTVQGYPNQTRLEVTDETGANVYDGNSPATVRLRRKGTYKVTVSRAGFASETVTVGASTNWNWLIPAFTITGPFEIISFANGSVKEFSDDGIEVTIFPEGRRPAAAVAYDP